MEQTRSGFVYLWFDRKHNRYYLGSHWGDENDGYICSSSWMKKAYKLRPDDFKRRILSRVSITRAGLLLEEQRWLDMIKPEEVKVRYYNLKLKSHPVWHTDDGERLSIGQKISAAKSGKKTGPCSPEKAKAISEAKKASFDKKQETLGYKMSPEHIAKMAATKTGKPQSPESNAKRSATIQSLIASGIKLGTQGPLSNETKRKIGNAHRGMKRTKETCKNIAQSVSKAYIIKYTDGSQETVVGLKAYASERGLPYGSITSALRDNISMRKYGIASINRA
jgi:hypothetical protein